MNNHHHKFKVGAPPGLTVHWLHLELSASFKKEYQLTLNRKHHNYRYARYRKRTLIDEFLVVRTSKRCYRVIYFNEDFKFFRYFSCENYRSCAEKMIEIFKIFKKVEEKFED